MKLFQQSFTLVVLLSGSVIMSGSVRAATNAVLRFPGPGVLLNELPAALPPSPL